MNSFLEIKGLKSNNLDISIEKNTISTFSGANNCGKTTLIRILSKLLDIESEITLENKKISDYKLEEYNEIVKSVIPKEIIFDEINIEEELYNNQDDVLKLFAYNYLNDNKIILNFKIYPSFPSFGKIRIAPSGSTVNLRPGFFNQS